MIIIIDIGHPGHVHFFKNFIWQMRKRGHEILITASDKEVTLDLLKAYNFEYLKTTKRYSGIMLGYELLRRDIQLYSIARKFKPDILMGINNTIAAHVSKVTNAKSIIFTDTEHARIANAITFPFSDVICTPSCYRDEIGEKQVRYNGYHELAYLHPNYFTPNPAVLDEIGLKPDDPFIILRFVSWGASHDVGHQGIKDKIGLVKDLEQYGRILITSEGPLLSELEGYRIRISPEKLHDLLYYATLYIGEGATMASEAAMLGTPSIFVSSLAGKMGNFIELEEIYDLLYSYTNSNKALGRAVDILQNHMSKDNWRLKRERLLKDKIDVTAFMVWFIENYPRSFTEVKKHPEVQYKFKSERTHTTGIDI